MTEAPTQEDPIVREGALRTADMVRAFAQLEGTLRVLARRLREGEALTAEEAGLIAVFVEFHAHYPAATLAAFAGSPVRH